jgi:hypothetical protein
MQTPYLSSLVCPVAVEGLLGRRSPGPLLCELDKYKTPRGHRHGQETDSVLCRPSCLDLKQRPQHHSNLDIRPQHLGSGHQRPVVGAAFPTEQHLRSGCPSDSEDPVLLPSIAWVISLQHSAGASHLFVPCFFFRALHRPSVLHTQVRQAAPAAQKKRARPGPTSGARQDSTCPASH